MMVLVCLLVGGGGSPVKPSTDSAGGGGAGVQGMDGVVLNRSLLELAATGQCRQLCITDSQLGKSNLVTCSDFLVRVKLFYLILLYRIVSYLTQIGS